MAKKTEDKKVHVDKVSGNSKGKIENAFELITLARKRVKELVSGAPKLIQSEIEDPMQIALEEIAQGKITVGRKQNIPEKKEEKKKSSPTKSTKTLSHKN